MDFDDDEEEVFKVDREARTQRMQQWNQIAAPYFILREIRIAIEASIDIVGDPTGLQKQAVEQCRKEELVLLHRCKAFDLQLLWDSLSVDHQRMWMIEHREIKKVQPIEAATISSAIVSARSSIEGVMAMIRERIYTPPDVGSSL